MPDHRRLLRCRSRTRCLSSVNAGYAWSAQSIPPTSVASTAFRAPRPPTARRWDSASSEAPSSSERPMEASTWTSEPVPPEVGILTASLMREPVQLSGRERLRLRFDSPSIIGTTNGGATWTSRTLPGDRDQLHRDLVRGHHALHRGRFGSAGPGAAILATTNGGTTWTPQPVPSGYTGALNGISCPSDTTCLATGSHVIGTTDGGSTGTTSELPPARHHSAVRQLHQRHDLHRRRRHEHRHDDRRRDRPGPASRHRQASALSPG